MNTNNMYNFLFVHGSKIAIVCLAALAGEGAALLDTVGDHPAVTSVLSGVAAALVIKYVDKWLEGRNKTIKTGDKILEIESAKQERLEKQQQALMAEKEGWWKLQNDRAKAEQFENNNRYRANIKEAREINHAAVNQLMTQQNIILGMQRQMFLHGLDVPEISVLELTKFMLPIWEQERLQIEGEKDGHEQDKTVADNTSKP